MSPLTNHPALAIEATGLVKAFGATWAVNGVLGTNSAGTSVDSCVTLDTDVTERVVDRSRTLPVWRPAPLIRAVLGDCVRYRGKG